MIDIRFLRENPEAVKENIRKKFQDAKLPLVDEVVDLDQKRRAAIAEVESLKAARNKLSKANGPLYGQLKKCEDEAKKAELQAQIDQNNAAVKADDDRRAELDQSISQMDARIREIMYVIPNIIDPSVPIGPDDSCNVEVERFGDPVVPTFEIPHHVDIMASFNGIDKESAGRVAGMGFYYLLGDIARLHEAVLAYARDFMIDEKGFTYVIPPSMTATREANENASSKRCSVKRTVVPNSRLILPRVAKKSDAAIGSSWLVGSSKISTFGCKTITEARFKSCFCPPDSSVTGL